jgi:hypothetical protein
MSFTKKYLVAIQILIKKAFKVEEGFIMEPNAIIETVMGQGVFASLFIWLFFTYQKESRDREERLMSIVDKQSEKLETISVTLEKISHDMNVK